MAKIKIFQHSNYGNPSEEHTEGVAALTTLNNHMSSCQVVEGTWILYTGENYGMDSDAVEHQPSILHKGDFANPTAMKLANDKVSSLRPLPDRGICLFEKPNYCGQMISLAEGEQRDTLPFAAQSVIVISGEWNLYAAANFGGDPCSTPVGKYAHQPQGLLNRTVASVKPAQKGNLVVVSRAAGDVTGSAPKLELLDTPSVELILDASGSMEGSRMSQARQVLTNLIDNDLPDGIKVALRVFGPGNLQGRQTPAGAGITTLVQELETLNRENLKAKINTISAGGWTPIAASLKEAQVDLKDAPGSKLVVLITDGNENCGGNVEQEITNLRAAFDKDPDSQVDDFEVVMNVVGFAIGQDSLKQKFADWAKAGGGGYYDATDSDKLYTLTKAALRIPFSVELEGDEVGGGFVDGDPVELDPYRGYIIKLDFTLGKEPDGRDKKPRSIKRVNIAAGETTEVPIVRWP